MHILGWCRMLYMWMSLTCIVLYGLQPTTVTFLQTGPNKQFIFMGLVIDTYQKYCTFIAFTLVNVMCSAVHQQILNPWIILNIQDESVCLIHRGTAYHVTLISTIYNWFAWFMNMMTLLTQIDVFCFNVYADIIIHMLISRYHIRRKESFVSIGIPDSLQDFQSSKNRSELLQPPIDLVIQYECESPKKLPL
jgi:hypothetical protein